MSVIRSALASIRIDLRSGCGALAIGAEPSRLSEKLFLTERSSGEPGRAMNVVFFASKWMLPAALRNCPTYSPPMVYHPPIVPAKSPLPDAAAHVDRQKERLVELLGRDFNPGPIVLLPDRKKAGNLLGVFDDLGKRAWRPCRRRRRCGAAAGAATGRPIGAGVAVGAAGAVADGAGVAAGIAEAAVAAAAALCESLLTSCVMAHDDSSIAPKIATKPTLKRDTRCVR